jgi:outer membrane protein OmpA-like peptidoglycan-associated protein
MKTKFCLALACLILWHATTILASAHSPVNNDPIFDSRYVVVIGAYAIKGNADRATTYAKKRELTAKFIYNNLKELYYVYTFTTNDKQQAIDEALRLRTVKGYEDAWVYHYNTGTAEVEVTVKNTPVAEVATEDVVVNEVIEVVEPVVEQPVEEEANTLVAPPDSKLFYLETVNASNNRKVAANIDVIDIDRTRKSETVKSNESTYITSPKSNSGKVSLITTAFGYRKQQLDIDFNNPLAGGYEESSKGILIPFELVRLHKGDIVVMYNVFFFKDAAVMMPESQYEVNSLLEMMEENPNLKIVIHGHTNGNSSGKIIRRGEEDDFFSLTGSVETIGTAKALSEARARAIYDYLVSKGVDNNRMTIKAWGGKKPLYDKNSNRAKDNIRVEIEIVQD